MATSNASTSRHIQENLGFPVMHSRSWSWSSILCWIPGMSWQQMLSFTVGMGEQLPQEHQCVLPSLFSGSGSSLLHQARNQTRYQKSPLSPLHCHYHPSPQKMQITCIPSCVKYSWWCIKAGNWLTWLWSNVWLFVCLSENTGAVYFSLNVLNGGMQPWEEMCQSRNNRREYSELSASWPDGSNSTAKVRKVFLWILPVMSTITLQCTATTCHT